MKELLIDLLYNVTYSENDNLEVVHLRVNNMEVDYCTIKTIRHILYMIFGFCLQSQSNTIH